MRDRSKKKCFRVICEKLSRVTDSACKEKEGQCLVVYYGNTENNAGKNDFFMPILSWHEVERLKKFHFERDQLTYCLSHGFLRLSLSEKFNTSPEKLVIEYGKNAKPNLNIPNSDFNLSHSQNYFAYTITNKPGGIVGVDIEKVNSFKDYMPILNGYMHLAEKSYVLDNDLSEQERLGHFYEIWTRKEAFLKMLGIGIIIDLSALNMAPGENNVWVNVPENVQSNSQEIYIYTISANNFVLSVCANFPYLACFEEIKSN